MTRQESYAKVHEGIDALVANAVREALDDVSRACTNAKVRHDVAPQHEAFREGWNAACRELANAVGSRRQVEDRHLPWKLRKTSDSRKETR